MGRELVGVALPPVVVVSLPIAVISRPENERGLKQRGVDQRIVDVPNLLINKRDRACVDIVGMTTARMLAEMRLVPTCPPYYLRERSTAGCGTHAPRYGG